MVQASQIARRVTGDQRSRNGEVAVPTNGSETPRRAKAPVLSGTVGRTRHSEPDRCRLELHQENCRSDDFRQNDSGRICPSHGKVVVVRQ